MAHPADPDLPGDQSTVLVRLVDESPKVSHWEMPANWRISKQEVTHYLDTISELDKTIEVLVKAKELMPKESELYVDLKADIKQKMAEREYWESCLIRMAACNKTQIEYFEQRERQLRAKLINTRKEVRVLQRTVEALEGEICSIEKMCKWHCNGIEVLEANARTLKEKNLEMECELGEKHSLMDLTRKKDEAIEVLETSVRTLENKISEKNAEMERELWEKHSLMDLTGKKDEAIEALETTVRTLENRSREKNAEMERELGEKDLLMELTRKKDEAKKLQIEEEHGHECEELRLKAQQAEALFTSFSKVFHESFETALQDTVSKSSHLQTRLRSAESTRLGAGGHYEDII